VHAHGGSGPAPGPPWLRLAADAVVVARAGQDAPGYVGTVRCPFCSADDDKVVDSRPADDGSAVRRRRECLRCGRRFTTYERLEELPLVVVKRSGGKEPFDPAKLRSGVERAVAGSAIDDAAVAELVAEIDDQARAHGHEVTSEWIGLSVLDRLRILDPVSYVRFASVYKGFEDLGDFEREVGELQKTTPPKSR
jgi:transcriptional repressor NrdR